MGDTAVLLIDCPDRRGLVADVAGLLYEHGANIVHADQHVDHAQSRFFMRVEFMLGEGSGQHLAKDLPQGKLAEVALANADNSSAVPYLERFRIAFAPLADSSGMRWNLISSERPLRVALFCSHYLHCVADLLYRWQSGELACEIPLIVSNHRAVEELAGFYGVRFECTPVTAATRAEVEQRQLEMLREHDIDLVVLARYMQVLTGRFVAAYPAAIINVHHSFLPAFTGARPYQAAHARGVKLIGATSHYVTEVLDDGPIIEQDVTRISHRDQVEDLVARGRDLERIVLSRAVRWHLDRRILCHGNKTVVFD